MSDLPEVEISQTFQRADENDHDPDQENAEAWKLAAWTRAAESGAASERVEEDLDDDVAADQPARQEHPILSERVVKRQEALVEMVDQIEDSLEERQRPDVSAAGSSVNASPFSL